MNSQNLLNRTIGRREWLAGAIAGSALPAFGANRIKLDRVSAITDEIARSPKDAILFLQEYGLRWAELRQFPGERGTPRPEYFMMPEADLKQAAKEFADGGIGISFLNTSMLKYYLPGSKPANARTKQDPRRYEKRKEELRKAMDAAHILGTSKVRVFTFWRVEQPETVRSQVSETLLELAEIAGKEKVSLLIENEGACNVATCEELVALMKVTQSKWLGINWDPLNAAHKKEVAFPDGYAMMPAKKIMNVQIKGRSILPGPELMDWAAIFKRLERDGYKGQVGLETHIFGEEQIARSHDSMKEIRRILS